MGEGAVPGGVQAEGRTAQQPGIDRFREGEIERLSPGGRSPGSHASVWPGCGVIGAPSGTRQGEGPSDE